MKSCQVNGAKAEAELAYSLQAAKVQAKIKEEEMQVKLSLCKNTKKTFEKCFRTTVEYKMKTDLENTNKIQIQK